MGTTRRTKAFIGCMALAAVAAIGNAVSHGSIWHPYLALTLLAIALATSRMKVRIPGINGNMSVNLPFLMLAVILLNATESILIACAASIVQTLPRDGSKLKPVRLLFNLSMMAVSSGVAAFVFHQNLPARLGWGSAQLLLAGTAAVFFLGQTLPVSVIVALTDGGTIRGIWREVAQMSFPYYVISAGMTSMVNSLGHYAGWLAALALLPVMFGIYRSYRRYFAGGIQPAPAMARAAGAGH